MLDGRPPAPGDALPATDTARLRDGLRLLTAITDKLRARRVASGALELAGSEMRFKVSAGWPLLIV